jgi:hypothetical protein
MKSRVSLRPALRVEAGKAATAEGVSLNQLVNAAVAEKVSALRTEEYFAERAARGDVKKALDVLKRAGRGNVSVSGDELSTRRRARRRVSGRAE